MKLKLSLEEAGALFDLLYYGVIGQSLVKVGFDDLARRLATHFEDTERVVWYDEFAVVSDD